MLLQIKDFNDPERVLGTKFGRRWAELASTLETMPLPLKGSQQDGKVGAPIFDPVAANAEIKSGLVSKGWSNNIPIPSELSFLGTAVDFFIEGLLVEAQFSNYPFFLNNVVRSALLASARAELNGTQVQAVVIVAKARMFPASNSTLYYEQAISQLASFSKYGLIQVPLRVVGLFAETNAEISATWNKYAGDRSRTLLRVEQVRCVLQPTRGDFPCSVRIVRP